MKLTVKRFGSNHTATLGAFYIDGKFKCFTVEDEKREVKVAGETRVPEGTYKVAYRKEGKMNAQYSAKYSNVHKGMLAIFNEPDWKLTNKGMTFQYVMIHKGNFESETLGCLLLNNGVNAVTMNGSDSGGAYLDAYMIISKALDRGEEVTIEYLDVEY